MNLTLLRNLKFKSQLFAAHNCAQIKLPELARETEARPALVEVYKKLQTKRPPKIRQRYVGANRFESDIRVERKELSIVDKAIEGITIEMIAVCRIRWPIGIRVMRSDDCDVTPRLCDAI